MAILDGWDIGEHEEDARLFEIPESPLAYVVSNLEEIGMAKYAGTVAVFRDKQRPVRVFAPIGWDVYPSPGMIRCDRGATVLFIYIANSSDTMEKYALVDLSARTFSPVFIPSALAGYTFTQLGPARFAMTPKEGDISPYHRSYLIEPTSLHWFRYTDHSGLDNVILQPEQRRIAYHYKERAWQIVWDAAYQVALAMDAPNDAQIVTDRVMARIDVADLEDVLVRTADYRIEPDDDRLRPLIERERATVRFERGEKT